MYDERETRGLVAESVSNEGADIKIFPIIVIDNHEKMTSFTGKELLRTRVQMPFPSVQGGSEIHNACGPSAD